MSETVLAAMIAAGATILTTLLQLKISLGRDGGATPRTPSSSRKKPKLPAMLLAVMLTAAAVGGFALSQWFSDRERVQQHELRQELQARITEISRTAGELRQSKLDTFAEVEVDVLRRMGGSGIVALATVGPCHGTPASTVSSSSGAMPAGSLLTAGALPRGSASTPGASTGGSAAVLGPGGNGAAPGSSGSAATLGSGSNGPTSALIASTATGRGSATAPASAGNGATTALNSLAAGATGVGSTSPSGSATSGSTPGAALMAGSAVAAAMGAGSAEPASSPTAAASTTNTPAAVNDSAAAGAQSAPGGSTCAEADATPVLLCAPIPSNAVVSHVDLFTRFADGDEPWNASQVAAGQEVAQARFSEKKLESLADDGMKHVCHKFANWSTQHARVARMIVRYAIPAEALEPQSQVSHKAIVGATGALAIR